MNRMIPVFSEHETIIGSRFRSCNGCVDFECHTSGCPNCRRRQGGRRGRHFCGDLRQIQIRRLCLSNAGEIKTIVFSCILLMLSSYLLLHVVEYNDARCTYSTKYALTTTLKYKIPTSKPQNCL
jgi:hypothetical protein